MRNLPVALILACLPPAALGQDLLQCLHPDVVNGLLSGTGAEPAMRITRDLPVDMAEFRAPDGFELIGTAVREGGMIQSVAFRTELASDRALTALSDSLAVEGWEIEASQTPAQTFNVASRPQNAVVCRNAERRYLSVEAGDDVRFASIRYLRDDRGLACHAEDPRLSQIGPGMFAAMRERMPSLDFPPTARAVAGGTGMGGSGGTVSTASRIESPDSAASLVEHLGQQMVAQGWRRDASWSGSLSSGSTWVREDDRPYWITLEIVSIDADIYEVDLMLVTQPL